MSVRNALLAILAEGPCYGNQLRAELARRSAGALTVNVGQIYTTLDRLERDGLATRGTPDAAGHIHWTITPSGTAVAREWLSTPVASATSDVAVKIAIALTLPGVDAASLIAAQRAVIVASLDDPPTASGATAELLADLAARTARAELDWLDRVEASLGAVAPYPIAAEPPKRGRPTR